MRRRVFEGKLSGSGYLPEYEFMSKRHTEGLFTPLLNGPWFYPRPAAKHWSLTPIHGEFFSQFVKGCPLINYPCSYLRFRVCFFVNSAASIGPTEDWNNLPLDSGPVQSQWFPVRSVQQSLTRGRVMWVWPSEWKHLTLLKEQMIQEVQDWTSPLVWKSDFITAVESSFKYLVFRRWWIVDDFAITHHAYHSCLQGLVDYVAKSGVLLTRLRDN